MLTRVGVGAREAAVGGDIREESVEDMKDIGLDERTRCSVRDGRGRGNRKVEMVRVTVQFGFNGSCG